jgi:hypothetical protein
MTSYLRGRHRRPVPIGFKASASTGRERSRPPPLVGRQRRQQSSGPFAGPSCLPHSRLASPMVKRRVVDRRRTFSALSLRAWLSPAARDLGAGQVSSEHLDACEHRREPLGCFLNA